jgi:hypothetical protein
LITDRERGRMHWRERESILGGAPSEPATVRNNRGYFEGKLNEMDERNEKERELGDQTVTRTLSQATLFCPLRRFVVNQTLRGPETEAEEVTPSV